MMKILTSLLFLLVSLGGASAAAERVLIVVTNHSSLGDTGAATGYFLSEVAHPWHVFTKSGYAVDFASPAGGFAPMDPKSFDLEDPVNKEFWHTLEAVEGLADTKQLATIDTTKYEAIFFAGGHGTMWDFPDSESIAETIAQIYSAGGVVGAVCHGPAALVGVSIDGKPLVQGRKVAAFTNSEESAVDLTDEMPFLLETRLRELGAEFVGAPDFTANVVVDGRLVTGQNPASAEETAKAIVDLLD